MEIKFYEDIDEFYNLVLPFLLEREAENNLLISLLNRIKENPTRYSEHKPILITVTDNKDIELVSLRTPPYNLILSYSDNLEVIDELARELLKKNIKLPGVLGFKDAAEKFVQLWCGKKNLKHQLMRNERIYKLEHVTEDTLGNKELEIGSELNQSLILNWANQFVIEALPERDENQLKRNQEMISEDIKNNQIFLLKDKNKIVSIARKAGQTPNGTRVSLVYTPPELRRRGYATECVAKLSKYILEEGKKYCFLFADLMNPISNSIYTKIGYQLVIDVDDYKFLPK